MAKKPKLPIVHINPPTAVPDRVIPPKPGTFDPVLPIEENWPYVNPKPKKPSKQPQGDLS